MTTALRGSKDEAIREGCMQKRGSSMVVYRYEQVGAAFPFSLDSRLLSDARIEQ